MFIHNCGEIFPGENWNFWDDDKSGDKLPPFPEDWDQKSEEFTVYLALKCFNLIF